jgi:FkbM family methyltransferase
MTVREDFYNAVWGLGVRTLHLGKRAGVSGPFEHAVEQIANRLIPAPTTESVVSLPSGMAMVVPPGFAKARTYVVGYEREVTQVFQRIVKEGMGVVDVGAFCGYYTLLSSRLVGSTGHVYAFEPHAKSYTYLQRNVNANDCRNVALVNKAVFSATGFTGFALHKEADHHWLSSSSFNDSLGQVPTTSLDDFFAERGWPSIDLIKLDIEGGEKAALEGMRELSRRNPQLRLITEFDAATARRSGATVEGLATTLTELGFSHGYMIEQRLKSFSISQTFPRTHACYNLLLSKEADR